MNKQLSQSYLDVATGRIVHYKKAVREHKKARVRTGGGTEYTVPYGTFTKGRSILECLVVMALQNVYVVCE